MLSPAIQSPNINFLNCPGVTVESRLLHKNSCFEWHVISRVGMSYAEFHRMLPEKFSNVLEFFLSNFKALESIGNHCGFVKPGNYMLSSWNILK